MAIKTGLIMINLKCKKRNRYPFLILTLLILLLSSLSYAESIASVEQTSKAFTRIAKSVTPTVVFIKVEKMIQTGGRQNPFNNPFDLYNDDFFKRFFGQRHPFMQEPRERKQMGQGTGFIISKEGYILTNHHVVGDADKITVKLKDGKELDAKIVGTDPKSDIAIIKIKGNKSLPVLPMGDSDALEVGEWVMAVGNPFGLTHTITVGVVSAKGRTSVGITDYEDFIQTDAAINPGNSGGPLVNIRGEVIGINSAIFSKSGGYMGIGFAIPVNMVKAVKKQLIEDGTVTRGHLGVIIQDLSDDFVNSFDLDSKKGVLISDVTKDSPAEKGGIKRGDVVIEFNGKAVSATGHFRNMVSLVPPGSNVKLKVIRNGKEKTLSVKIGKQDSGLIADANRSDVIEKLGFNVQNMTSELAYQFGYNDIKGVVVTEVVSGSSAQFGGIKPGTIILEVNRKRIKTTKEFMTEVNRSKGKILLLVRDLKISRYIILRLE